MCYNNVIAALFWLRLYLLGLWKRNGFKDLRVIIDEKIPHFDNFSLWLCLISRLSMMKKGMLNVNNENILKNNVTTTTSKK